MNRKDGNLTTLLNKRVELWRNATSDERNVFGQYARVEERAATMWAAVIPQTGSLLSGRTADTTLSRTTHKFVIRYREDIKPSDWFVYKGERYNILYALDPYANHERLEVYCEAVSIK